MEFDSDKIINSGSLEKWHWSTGVSINMIAIFIKYDRKQVVIILGIWLDAFTAKD